MVRRHALVLIVALVAGSFAAAQTATVPGAANLSGTVESSAPYTAAQVFIRNTDKRMLYPWSSRRCPANSRPCSSVSRSSRPVTRRR